MQQNDAHSGILLRCDVIKKFKNLNICPFLNLIVIYKNCLTKNSIPQKYHVFKGCYLYKTLSSFQLYENDKIQIINYMYI